MSIAALQASINDLDQPSLDKAVFEEVFCWVGEPRHFSTTSELAEEVIAELYDQQVIASADISITSGNAENAGLLHKCTLVRPFIGTELCDVMQFEMVGPSIPIAICRAAVLICRSIVSGL